MSEVTATVLPPDVEDTPSPPLQRAVDFWCMQLIRSDDRLDPQDRQRTKLAAELRPILKIVYQQANLERPETCPCTSEKPLKDLLARLDHVVGIGPERVNDLFLSILDHGQRQLGWRLPEAPPTRLRLPRELPLLTPDTFVGLTSLDQLQDALDAAIGNPPSCGAQRHGPARSSTPPLYRARCCARTCSWPCS